MGYFANLYVIDASADEDGVTLSTNVFGSEIAPRAYFSWGVGQRPPGMNEYADGTIFADSPLRLLPGYPLIEACRADPDHCLLEASFAPPANDDPVLFHVMLPLRFVPARVREPFTQPATPFLMRLGDRLIATYPAIGPAELRFWISRLPATDSLDSYDLANLFHPEARQAVKAEFEFNLGFFKVKVS
jgi:hypothetical protein